MLTGFFLRDIQYDCLSDQNAFLKCHAVIDGNDIILTTISTSKHEHLQKYDAVLCSEVAQFAKLAFQQ